MSLPNLLRMHQRRTAALAGADEGDAILRDVYRVCVHGNKFKDRDNGHA